jgi:hypothetical protein
VSLSLTVFYYILSSLCDRFFCFLIEYKYIHLILLRTSRIRLEQQEESVITHEIDLRLKRVIGVQYIVGKVELDRYFRKYFRNARIKAYGDRPQSNKRLRSNRKGLTKNKFFHFEHSY